MSAIELPSVDPDVRVMVVDDEVELAELTAIWVREKWPCEVAHRAQEALDVLDGSFDVVLLDRQMPDMSGDELLEEIRAGFQDLQVMMVSAVDPDLDVIGMPFDHYLPKPVDRDELQAAIEKLLVRRTYPRVAQEYFAALSKIQVLEASNSYDYLAADDRYLELRNHAEDIRRTTDVRLGDISSVEGEMYEIEADD